MASTRSRYSILVKCFGEDIERYVLLVELILRRNECVVYSFMPIDVFESIGRETKSVARLNQMYWREMLDRAHLASCTSLRRNLGWMDAVALCAANNSFLGFAANLRALVESTGDSADVLAKMPKNIAKDLLVPRTGWINRAACSQNHGRALARKLRASASCNLRSGTANIGTVQAAPIHVHNAKSDK